MVWIHFDPNVAELPKVSAGLKEMKVIKTTKSGFEGMY